MKTRKMVFMAALAILIVAANAYSQQTGDFQWELVPGRPSQGQLRGTPDSVRITAYMGTATSIRILDQIAGMPVAHIGAGVFADRGLTSVTLPRFIQVIEESAFEGNLLTAIEFRHAPHSLQVAYRAFANNQFSHHLPGLMGQQYEPGAFADNPILPGRAPRPEMAPPPPMHL